MSLFPPQHEGDDSSSSQSCPETHPPLLFPPPHHLHPKPSATITMNLAAFVFGASLLLAFLVAFVRRSCLRRNETSPGAPLLFSVRVDSLREGDHSRIDHPVWLINTVGLDQSVVDLIAVCKFNKYDGLTDGTECTICLGEFEEGEDLRLLPKCSHAFHVPCIDTWLRSHKNCPLCRAPIVRDVNVSCGREPIVRDVNVSCGDMNLEGTRSNRGSLGRSITMESRGAVERNSGCGSTRGGNEARNKKGIQPSVMEICRTSVVDNPGRFAKEAKSMGHAVRSSKAGESSRNQFRRSSSDAEILSLERISKRTPMF